MAHIEKPKLQANAGKATAIFFIGLIVSLFIVRAISIRLGMFGQGTPDKTEMQAAPPFLV